MANDPCQMAMLSWECPNHKDIHPTCSISNALLQLKSNDAHAILGSPDDMKLKSCMTLFASFPKNPVFQAVLDKFYAGAPDEKTLRIINRQG